MSYDQNSSKQIDGTIITEGINWSKFSGMGYFYSVSADKVNLVMGLKEWHNWFEAAEKYEGKWEGKVTGFVSEESEEVEEHQRDARLVFIHALGALVAAFILKIELNKQQAVHPKKHLESITAPLFDFCDGWGLHKNVLPIRQPS